MAYTVTSSIMARSNKSINHNEAHCRLLIAQNSLLYIIAVNMERASSATAFVCPECNMEFGSKLYDHLFNAHCYSKQQIESVMQRRREKVMATENPYTCDVCGSLFTNLRSMRTHQRKKHADMYTSRTICCPLCSVEVSTHRELAMHARFTHAQDEDDYVVERISFSTMREFKEWKALTEETNIISRVIHSTSRSSSNAKITYMRCHRALKTPHVIPHKTKKAVPYCTAYMKIVEDGEVINVEHCFTHIAHDANPAMLKLDEKAVQYITSLLKEGLTVRQVYRRLREKVRDTSKNRLYFTTVRDIRNIAAKCCIQPGKLHNLDTVSIQLRVDKNCPSDGIQYFSPAHNANGDGFKLVIITPTQRDWLKRYGQKALCVDDTFNLTSYALRLATVVVADEFDRGLPAAYLLSYRMTESETAILFEQVKKLLPSFHTDYFMSDDTNTFWNGFARVFPTDWTQRLLCIWHVKQAIKRNAQAKLNKMELLEPFMQKVHEVCLIREQDVFVSKYSSLLKHLRDSSETRLAAYLENSWSHRIKEWAAFGRMRACVSTSMLCERFHKRLKHDILQGKPNVRIDSLVHLLIALTVETEEERAIMKERGVLEGRYRLQQHHRWHKAAMDKYATQQDSIVSTQAGRWQIKDGSATYNIQEHFCPCDSEHNNHCRKDSCGACPYAFSCNCSLDTKCAISCMHVHAVVMFACQGRQTLDGTNDGAVEVVSESDSDSEDQLEDDNIMDTVVLEDDDEEEPSARRRDDEEEPSARRRSTDIRDSYRDLLQRIEMEFAVGRTHILSGVRNPTEESLATLKEALHCMEEFARKTVALEPEPNENSQPLVRRPEVPTVGRPQAFTPIRKLHKRSHLRKSGEPKRGPLQLFPDYDVNDRDTCAACLRMEPVEGTGDVHWIQCPTCDNWFHMQCINGKCPGDGTVLLP